MLIKVCSDLNKAKIASSKDPFSLRPEVLTPVKMSMLSFWVVARENEGSMFQ
jgi:hypothetical protein